MLEFFKHIKLEVIWQNTLDTLYMTFYSSLAASVIGLILGLILFLTYKNNLWQNKIIYFVLSIIVNVLRAIPFIILIFLLIEPTKWLLGTFIGPTAALPSLIIGASAFYARLVEIALREVDKGVIEAARAMGSNDKDIILKVLIPESMPALVSGITVTIIALIGSTAVAGLIGSGGLGNLAYIEGFQRSHHDVTLVATLVIVLIVFAVQTIGDGLTRWLDRR